MRFSTLLLVSCLFGASARADDVLLVPRVIAEPGIDPFWAANVERMLLEVLRDNAFVVLDEPTMQRAAGDVLSACPPSELPRCVREALMSVPARIGLVARLQPRVQDGLTVTDLVIDYYDQAASEPVGQVSLPIESGKERRVALQVAMFSLDVVTEVGPSSPAMVESARQLAAPPAVRVYGVQTDLLEEEPEEVPETLAEGEDLEDPEDDEPIPVPSGPPGGKELPPRLYTGSRGAYEARSESPEAWYAHMAPHAGRMILELRGGLGHSDINRAAISLGQVGADGDFSSIAWLEGPVKGVAGRAEAFIGYAPATMLDFGVIAGVHVARDTVVVGYMAEEEAADLGVPKSFAAARPFLQPRIRLFPVTLGSVKPYLAVGAEFEFVSLWKFDVQTGEPFPRPPGGLLYSVVGGLGLCFDPHPRVGIVLEATMNYHLGDLAKNRSQGTLVGSPPTPPDGSGYGIVAVAGLQFRL